MGPAGATTDASPQTESGDQLDAMDGPEDEGASEAEEVPVAGEDRVEQVLSTPVQRTEPVAETGPTPQSAPDHAAGPSPDSSHLPSPGAPSSGSDPDSQ